MSNSNIEEDIDIDKINKYNENETSSDINNYIKSNYDDCVDKNINHQVN